MMFFEMMELVSDGELDFVARKRDSKELDELIAEANLRMYMGRSERVCI